MSKDACIQLSAILADSVRDHPKSKGNMKMKLLILSQLVIGSGSFAQNKVPAKNSALTQKTMPSKTEINEGKQLIAKSDCMACHKLNEKSVGPSYKDVAKKYPLTNANLNALASKIIKGGSGVWGKIPMPTHPGISVEDSRKIVKYILSVDTK